MKKEIWLKTNFADKKTPDWICPYCNSGILKLDTFKKSETALSRSYHSDDGWEPEFSRYTFSGSLICQNCNEFVSFLGDGSEEFSSDYDNRDDYHEINYSLYSPVYFHPTLQLFELNSNCPIAIERVINESFALYWNDLTSCVNKIRVSLELLMDEFKVKKILVNKRKKQQRLSLHHRIEEFKNVKPEIAEYLLAIKWIGNAGSHIGTLEKIDILETYELLELSLNKLYDDTEKKLKKIAKEINKRKGKIKRN
ncbi:MAG: DUF4145 domain-containing protein [Bacteroidia bacterium]